MAYIPFEIRDFVRERANGRCEYCMYPESLAFSAFEIDHIISLKHGGETSQDNLALSCPICNKYKGSDIASIDHETGNMVALYHPRKDRWTKHFRFENGLLVPLTPVGRATARLLRLNAIFRVVERKLPYISGLYERLRV